MTVEYRIYKEWVPGLTARGTILYRVEHNGTTRGVDAKNLKELGRMLYELVEFDGYAEEKRILLNFSHPLRASVSGSKHPSDVLEIPFTEQEARKIFDSYLMHKNRTKTDAHMKKWRRRKHLKVVSKT